jgi:hypothetical protein
VVLLQDNLALQPANSSEALKKASLQRNKLAESLERAAVMQNHDDLHQENSARLWEKSFGCNRRGGKKAGRLGAPEGDPSQRGAAASGTV